MAKTGWFLLTAPVIALAGTASAGDAEPGLETVIDWCGGCHVVGVGEAPPARPPAFSTILDLKTPDSIEHYLSWERHEGMPSLALEEDDIADIVAYFEHLQRTGK
ncbi:MAG: cytochrome c [Inquilinus sp.]|nr:cytochrome c [Inquilinus sp.]